ncbi:MAG: molybdopterin-dependent oxidoreductase [Actinomycetes bacterium]
MVDHLHICPLCEATCGLLITVENGAVARVRGDADDVFSHGFICPKGTSIGQLHADPDRLRQPLVRDPSTGRLEPSTWEGAFDVIRRRLAPVITEHGADAVGLYLGNPNVHNLSSAFYLPAFVRALGTINRFSASTVDQFPKQAASALMFGTGLSVLVPDIDRTDYLLVLGANPLVSNGSMMTVPDVPGRLRALRGRGGRLVVVDPIRTRTARAADEHVPIRPGSDAFLLAAIANVLCADGLASPGRAAEHLAPGALDTMAQSLRPFSPEAVANMTDVPADTIRRLAHELAAGPRAAVYGRMGTTTTGLSVGPDTTVHLGTVASWLIDVVNLLLGSVDEPGGVMWPLAPAGGPTTEGTSGVGRGAIIPGRKRSRVRGLPSIFGEFPAAALAEEIDTPSADDARIRALFVVAGNPVVSTPDGRRLEAALTSLDFMVSIDPYVTETSRHADVILPVPSPLARKHFDVTFANLAVRNTARFSPAALDAESTEMDESQILLQLTSIAFAIASNGPEPSTEDVDDLIALTVAQQAGADEASRCHGRQAEDLMAAVAPRRGIERLLDLRIRSGPYGDGFGAREGLTLAQIEDAPHGIDLGPLQPRLPEVLRTPTGLIELVPSVLIDALRDAERLLEAPLPEPSLVLVGRRQLRSNNSWLHNTPALAGGSNQCALLMHPMDAARVGLVDGQEARIATATGEAVAPVTITDDVRPGVVCMPHGWGHSDEGTWGAIAHANPGTNVNVIVSSRAVDPLSGTSALAGMAVAVTPA